MKERESEYLMIWHYRDRRIASGQQQMSVICAKGYPEAQQVLYDGIAKEFSVDKSEVVIDEVRVEGCEFRFGKTYVPEAIAETVERG